MIDQVAIGVVLSIFTILLVAAIQALHGWCKDRKK